MKKNLILFGITTFGFLSFGQETIYEANNTATFGAWTFVDADADTYNWTVADVSSIAGMASQGDAIRSFSSNPNNFSPLTPNNFAASVSIDLTNFSNVTVSWNRGSSSAALFAEKYAVYAVSAANQTALLAALATATPIYEEIISTGQIMEQRSIDISSLDGMSNVYIVFRHYDCTGQFFLVIDDVLVEGDENATSSIEQLNSDVSVNVFPNPTGDLLTIESDLNIKEISLLDQNGKVVYFETATIGNSHKINMQAFTNGVYFVKVLTTDGSISLLKCVK